MTTRLTGKEKKKADVWVSTGHQHTADAAKFTIGVELNCGEICFDQGKVKQTECITELGSLALFPYRNHL